MADDELNENDENLEDGAEGAEGEEEKGGGSKKKLIILLIAVIILIGGAAGGMVFMGIIPLGEDKKSEEELANIPQQIYYDLEEFLVNLNNPGKQVNFLKMTVTLELGSIAARNQVESSLPRVRDTFQVYLRELRSADLQGSAGIQRLREELLLRINRVISPEEVKDILFKEIIVQ